MPANIYDNWVEEGKPILFSSKFTSLSGFGYQAMRYAVALSRTFDVYIQNSAQSSFDYSEEFQKLLSKKITKNIPVMIYDSNLDVLSHSSIHPYIPYKGYYTMFETDHIMPFFASIINSYDFCIVPSTFCRRVFEESGVTVPIYIVPHGVDSEEFTFKKREDHPEYFVFGTYGQLTPRKGVDIAIKAFLKAFPKDKYPQVYLHIKSTYPVQYWKESDDPRIMTYDPIVLSRKNLVKILHTWNCLVFPSRGEGCGLPALESLSTGLPVIATNFSGITDYITESTGYPVDYTLRPAFGYNPAFDGQLGNFAEASVDHLAERMMEVYTNYPLALEKTRQAALQLVKTLSWDSARETFAEAVQSFMREHTLSKK